MVRGSRNCPPCGKDVCDCNVNIIPLGHGSIPLGGFFFLGTPGKGRFASLKALC